MDTEQASTTFDVAAIRAQFPILSEQVYGQRLAYLDNAATTQKPSSVIQRIVTYYEQQNSNVHRGVHFLSQTATDAFEDARRGIAEYINASETSEVIFTTGTTESVNLVADTFGRTVGSDDRILITEMEHHSNIVPWQMLCERSGASLDVAPVTQAGELDMDRFAELLERKPRLVAIVHTSNSLGTINDVKKIVSMAHDCGALVLVDGAQAMAHQRVDVADLDCDFFCISAHKMFGPTGIGVLFGKKKLLDSLPPYRGGGDMIDQVSFSGTTYAELPARLEAGTPNIAGAIGFGEAIRFLKGVDMDQLAIYESESLERCTQQLTELGGITVIGTAQRKASVISFNIDGVHPYDTGSILDRQGVAIRTGHHCTMPLMERWGLPGTVRASFALYNNDDDINQFITAVDTAKRMLT